MFTLFLQFVLFQISLYQRSLSQICIENDIIYGCVSVQNVSPLSNDVSDRIYALLSLSYTDPNGGSSTQSLQSKTSNPVSFQDISLTACVPTSSSDQSLIDSLSIEFYNRDDSNNRITTFTVADIGQNIFSQTDIKLNEDKQQRFFDNAYFSPMLTYNITLEIWKTNTQCIQIISGNIFAADNYMLSFQLYRTDNDVISFTGQASVDSDGVATWGSPWYICVPNEPDNSNNYMYGIFELFSTTHYNSTTDISYPITGIDGISVTEPEYQFIRYDIYTSATPTTINFDIGDLDIILWESCDYLCNITIDTCSESINEIDDSFIADIDIDSFDISCVIYVIILLLLLLLLLFCSAYTSKRVYPSSDPPKYDHIIFFVTFLWTSTSQILLTVFVWRLTLDTNQSLIYGVLYSCLVLICLSYIVNIIFLTHYLQVWNHALAPGVTRHWLQSWSWLLIFICSVLGNFNIALELCNSLLIPIEVFAMHLPRSEMVNCRVNRLLTNSLTLELPILVMSIILLSSSTDLKLNRFIVYNTLIACLITFISTLIHAFLRRNYSNKNPVALYRFSFTFKCVQFESYFVHSHHRIQRSFADVVTLRKTSLVIIDQSSEILSCMKIEGRILQDPKQEWDKTKTKAAQNIVQVSKKLKEILSKQFGLGLSSVDVENFQFVAMRDVHGQLVYDYDTAVKQFFEMGWCYNVKTKDIDDNNTGNKNV